MDMEIVNDYRRRCNVWCARIFVPKNTDPIEYNYQIRNWLESNVSSGTWETSLTGVDFTDTPKVRVIFDLNAKEDAMAFKLRWS